MCSTDARPTGFRAPIADVTKGGLETGPWVSYVLDMYRIAALILLLFALPLRADEALVAVAANFLKPAEVLAVAFTEETGHTIALASGSTGQHYAQILHGAPYDAFLAADGERPMLLAAQGVAQDPITYAIGRLAYVSNVPFMPDTWQAAAANVRLLAIANPDLAPYGRAAHEALTAVNLWDEQRTVQGQNVGQAFALVASGNVEGGLVAASMARGHDGDTALVSADLHAPILQDAVLLTRAKGNLAAKGFLTYLGSEAALAVIESFGYDRPDTVE